MKKAFILALCVCIAAALTGQAPRSSIADVVLKETLSNGLRVVIVRNTLAPVVSTVVTYLVGSRDDPADVPGMAHAQEHMMFRGTKDLSTAELGTIATALGGDFNASTSDLATQFQFTVPAADLDAVFRIESDRMRDVLDAQSQWESERGAIEQEVARDESAPGNKFFRSLHDLAFAGTPYGHDGVGTRAAFDRLTGPQIKAFHDRWYAPNNAVLVIAGDVDPQRTMTLVRQRFESIPKREVPAHAPSQLKPLQRTVLRQGTSLVYPLAVVAVRFPGILSQDFLPSYVLQGILDSERGPLHHFADTGEALSAQWTSMPYVPEAQLGFAAIALPPGSDPSKMAARVESILRGYAEHGVPADLFETTKHQLIVSQEQSRNSIASLASDWATTIAIDGEPSIAHEQDLIAAVTLADVNRTAKRYLDMTHDLVGALTPSAGATQAAPPEAAQLGAEKPLAPQPATTKLPDWGMALLERQQAPAASRAPSQMKLSNGMTLIVEPQAISDAVFLFGSVKSNAALQEPQGKEGVASVLATMFGYGTARRDRIEFQRAQDAADTQLIAGYDPRFQTTSAGFDRAVALLAENQLQPRFDQSTFDLARRRAIDELQTALNSSRTVAQRQAAQYLLPAGDPEFREPTPRTIQSLSLDDVKSYYEKTMRPDLTTIVVVGNVTPEAARAAIERDFAPWRASGPAPALDLPPLAANRPGEVRIPIPTAQDIVRLEEIVPLARSAPQVYPLILGNVMLGGGSLGPEQSRLFRDLRQNTGLVYSINSSFAPRRSRYQFSIEFASSPANEPRISALIDDEIAKMKAEPAGAFELSLAKASTVRRTVIADGAITAIAGTLLDEATNGLPFDQTQRDARALLNVDARAVQEAFAQYIDPRNFVRTIEGPPSIR